MKKFNSLLLVLVLVLAFIPAQATEATPNSTPYDGQVDYYWRVASKSATGTTSRGTGRVFFYEGAPATRTGETDTCGTSVSYSVEASGSFEISAGTVASSLGLSIGQSFTFEVSRTSAALEKGEYIKAYYTKNWQTYTIKQERVKHTTWYSYDEDGNPTGIHSTDEVVKTITGYIYKPLMPKITLEYYGGSARSASARSGSTPYKTEVYEWNGSSYVITQTYYK